MPRKRKPAPRRDRGQGSVYPAGDGSGAYIAQVRVAGRLIRRRAPDEQAAEAERARLVTLRDRGLNIGDATQPFRAWAQTWYEHRRDAVARGTLTAHTLREQREVVERDILPALGDVALNAVTVDHCQRLVDATLREIRAAGRYSGIATAHKVAFALSQIFDLAVRRKLIAESPMEHVELPPYRAAPVEPLTDEQLRAVLRAAWAKHDAIPAGHHQRRAVALRDVVLLHLYALLGLRRGEALGLRWDDIDLDALTLRVAQQIKEAPGGLVVAAPKTDAGRRTLPLVAPLPELLRAHRAAWLRLRVARADRYRERLYVFATRDGGPLWPANVNTLWYELRDAAGLPPTARLHHLRHTVATLLDEVGASEAIKRGVLGHEGRAVTHRYTHARLRAMRERLAALSARVLDEGERGAMTHG